MNEMFKLQIERTVCDTGLLSEQECLTTQQKLVNSYGSMKKLITNFETLPFKLIFRFSVEKQQLDEYPQKI